MSEAGYRTFDHTADAGLEAWGATPAEAFSAAARGMFAIILGADPHVWAGGEAARTLAIEVHGDEWPELLVNWLAELLFRFEVDGIVPIEIAVKTCQPPRCDARVEGVAFENAENLAGVGIKAVTYHELRVDVSPERTDIHVIFDI